MPIYRGSQSIVPNRGNEALAAVYRGSELVWSGEAPPVEPTRINYFSGRPTGMHPVKHPEAGFHHSWYGASLNGTWTDAAVGDDPIGRGKVIQRTSTGFIDVHTNRVFSLIARQDINNTPSEIAQPTMYLEKGKTYTLSFYIWASHTAGAGGQLTWIPISDGDAEVEIVIPGPPTPNQWFRTHVTFTASFGASGGPVQAPPTGIDGTRPGEWVPVLLFIGSSGRTIRYTGCLLEEGTEVRPYFDGDCPDAEWMGEPNQSMSLYYGPVEE